MTDFSDRDFDNEGSFGSDFGSNPEGYGDFADDWNDDESRDGVVQSSANLHSGDGDFQDEPLDDGDRYDDSMDRAPETVRMGLGGGDFADPNEEWLFVEDTESFVDDADPTDSDGDFIVHGLRDAYEAEGGDGDTWGVPADVLDDPLWEESGRDQGEYFRMKYGDGETYGDTTPEEDLIAMQEELLEMQIDSLSEGGGGDTLEHPEDTEAQRLDDEDEYRHDTGPGTK